MHLTLALQAPTGLSSLPSPYTNSWIWILWILKTNLGFDIGATTDCGAAADCQGAVGPILQQQQGSHSPAGCQRAAAAPQLGRQCQPIRATAAVGQGFKPCCHLLAAAHLQVGSSVLCPQNLNAWLSWVPVSETRCNHMGLPHMGCVGKCTCR